MVHRWLQPRCYGWCKLARTRNNSSINFCRNIWCMSANGSSCVYESLAAQWINQAWQCTWKYLNHQYTQHPCINVQGLHIWNEALDSESESTRRGPPRSRPCPRTCRTPRTCPRWSCSPRLDNGFEKVIMRRREWGDWNIYLYLFGSCAFC